MEISPSIFVSESKSWQDSLVKHKQKHPEKQPSACKTCVLTWSTLDINISIEVVTLEEACKQNKCLAK